MRGRRTPGRGIRRGAVVLLTVVVLLGAVSGVAAAQETRTGDTVVVGPDEEVDGLTAFGGTVQVEGTVAGDLTAFAGNVVVDGTVEGDVVAFSGNVRITGDVGGDVEAVAGSVVVEEGATIDGSFTTGAGSVTLAGTIGEDAEIGAGSIVVGPTAAIGGDFAYAGTLSLDENAQIEGTVTEEQEISVGATEPLGTIPSWIGTLYGFIVNLVLGAILLAVAPRFSAEVAERVVGDPLPSGGVGLLTLVGIPVLLVLFAITIIGIPFAILGAFLFVLLVWIGAVYGAFGLGTWILGLADRPNRWGALLVGLVLLALVGLVPILGGLFTFVVFLLGLGGLVLALYGRYRRRRSEPPAEAGATAAAESS